MSDIVAERSWEVLKELNQRYSLVVLGDWAAWLLSGKEKSHDIDVLVDFGTLQELRNAHETNKKEKLKKFEIQADGFDIGIYIPYYSTTLALPAEFVQQETTSIDGFTVPSPQVLLALKLKAWENRATSAIGEKDLVDIAGIMPLVDRTAYVDMLARALSDDGDRANFLDLYEAARLKVERSGLWQANSGLMGAASPAGGVTAVSARPASFSCIRERLDDETWHTIVGRYVWWKTPVEAEAYPEGVLARVMRMGTFDDTKKVADQVGDETLRDVVTHAQAGWFNERSWHYWHYRLGLCDVGAVPPLPRRVVP